MQKETLQTINRAFQILDCFSLDQYSLGVREVARMSGLPVSVCGRVMSSLRDLGMLNQDSRTKEYVVGAKSLRWAEIYLANLDIRTVAFPYINELLLLSKETISLYILDGDERLCVERMESAQNVRIVARIGRRLPLYAGSAGKVLLAFLPIKRQNEIIEITEFVPFTKNTIIDVEKLRHDLELIRKQCFAFSDGEWVSDAAGIAAPIFDHHDDIVAALTISGPSNRFTASNKKIHIRNILLFAEKISRDLGYIGTAYPRIQQH